MKKILFSLAVAGLLYFGWTKASAPHGAQQVKYTPALAECFSDNDLKYCVNRAAQGTNGDLAYHFHGRDLDEHSWNDSEYYTALIQRYWAENKIIPPIVVSISYGPLWLLTPKNSGSQSGLLEKFKQAMPGIEARIFPDGAQPKHRILFGESMGGINALILSLTTPALFSKVASMCPPISDLSPYAPLSEVKDFLFRTGADPKLIFPVLTIAKTLAGNTDEWNAFSPLQLVRTIPSTSAPKFYLSCGLYDKYGNFEGTQNFADIAKKRGISLEWHPQYGGHCATDIVSVADFIARGEPR